MLLRVGKPNLRSDGPADEPGLDALINRADIGGSL